MLVIDECSEFTEEQYEYLLRRMKRMESQFECMVHGKNHDNAVVQRPDQSVIIFCTDCIIRLLREEIGVLHETIVMPRKDQ